MKKIGIIGFGNMGSAIGQQIKSKYSVFVFDKDNTKIRNLSGVKVADSIIDLVRESDTIILAVKPQDFETVLDEINPVLRFKEKGFTRSGIKDFAKGKLVISIAAGINTKYIEKRLTRAKVIRVMPNLGARIGESVTCLCKGKYASQSALLFVKKLFNCIGSTKILNENKMNAVTAVSGSGPAYVCFAIESGFKKNNFLAEFKKAAKSVGFSQNEADFLVNNTFRSTIDVLKRTKIKPQELRRQVTSKGGTTEAALEVLNKGGSLQKAIEVAVERAGQLAKG